jgi:hypothetical protein
VTPYAWCAQPIDDAPVTDHGVPYHLGCWATREVVCAPELARERQDALTLKPLTLNPWEGSADGA